MARVPLNNGADTGNVAETLTPLLDALAKLQDRLAVQGVGLGDAFLAPIESLRPKVEVLARETGESYTKPLAELPDIVKRLSEGTVDAWLLPYSGLAGKAGQAGKDTADGFLKPLTDLPANAKKAVGATVDSFVNPLSTLARNVQRPLDTATGAIRHAAESAFIPLQAGLNLWAAATTGAVNTIQTLVGKANPAAAFQFNRAVDDLAATMGQVLTPVFEAVTEFVREFADVFQGLKPALAPIMNAVAEIIREFSTLLVPLAELFAPVLDIIGAVVQSVVVPAIKILVDVMRTFASVLKDVIETLTLGLIEFTGFQKGNSGGAAVRQPSYGGSILDIGKRTTINALMAGHGEKLTKDGSAIVGKLDQVIEAIRKGVHNFTAPSVGTTSKIAFDQAGLGSVLRGAFHSVIEQAGRE